MPIIYFADPSEGDWRHIYLHKQDDKSSHYCEVPCYRWIQSLGKENELDKVHFMLYMTTDLVTSHKPLKEYSLPLKKILEFPLLDEDTPYLVSIYNFFNCYEWKTRLSPEERIRHSIVYGSYPEVPRSLMKRLVQFVFQDYMNHPLRLRIFLSDPIHSYLKF